MFGTLLNETRRGPLLADADFFNDLPALFSVEWPDPPRIADRQFEFLARPEIVSLQKIATAMGTPGGAVR